MASKSAAHSTVAFVQQWYNVFSLQRAQSFSDLHMKQVHIISRLFHSIFHWAFAAPTLDEGRTTGEGSLAAYAVTPAAIVRASSEEDSNATSLSGSPAKFVRRLSVKPLEGRPDSATTSLKLRFPKRRLGFPPLRPRL